MDKAFWEKTYNDINISTFGTKPNKEIEAMWENFNKDWSILDVGCGEEKNTLFLAEKGFKNVNATDISQAAINRDINQA